MKYIMKSSLTGASISSLIGFFHMFPLFLIFTSLPLPNLGPQASSLLSVSLLISREDDGIEVAGISKLGRWC